MRLQNVIAKYKDSLYIDNIYFNENTYEIEVELFQMHSVTREDFVAKCNLIKEELEQEGYKCAYDDDYSEYTYMLYLII